MISTDIWNLNKYMYNQPNSLKITNVIMDNVIKTYPDLFNNAHACCWGHPFSRVNSTVYKYKWFGNILICLNLNNKKWHHYLFSRTNRQMNDFKIKSSRLEENWKTILQLICIYLPCEPFLSDLPNLHWYTIKSLTCFWNILLTIRVTRNSQIHFVRLQGFSRMWQKILTSTANKCRPSYDVPTENRRTRRLYLSAVSLSKVRIFQDTLKSEFIILFVNHFIN